jgi:hypothetical protein
MSFWYQFSGWPQVIGDHMRAVYDWLHHVSPEGWSALGTWTIAGVAAFATFFALRQVRFALHQVREARITLEKQAQPNVVAYAALNPEVSQYLDFVVTNYGQTPAYHVTLKFPVLTVTPYENLVTGEHTTELDIPDEIAVLAPGQEWRTLWDSAIEREQHRNKNDGRDVLGSRFEGTVKFQDSGGNNYTNPAILDWNSFHNTLSVGADCRFRLKTDPVVSGEF